MGRSEEEGAKRVEGMRREKDYSRRSIYFPPNASEGGETSLSLIPISDHFVVRHLIVFYSVSFLAPDPLVETVVRSVLNPISRPNVAVQ